MLILPKGFLEDEVRDDFLIEAEMKSYWASQLEIIKLIEEICDRHGLKYFAAYGTLLGAARHNGFIPWDDDVDIAMLRDDYETFIQVAKDEVPEEYRIIDVHSKPDWEELVSSIVNAQNMYADDTHLIKNHGCPYIVGIDIFPFDYMPENVDENERKDNYINLCVTLINFIKDNNNQKNAIRQIQDKGLSQLEKSFGFKFDLDGNIVNQLYNLIDFISSSYGMKNGDLVTHYGNYTLVSKSFVFHKLWFSEAIVLGFEFTNIKAPIGIEAVLNINFGDKFMIPVQVSSKHAYPAYKYQREKLIESGYKDLVDSRRKWISDTMCSDEVEYAKEEEKPTISAEYMEKLSNRKVILYVLNSANIIRHGEQFYDKVERAIEIFDESKDKVALILAEDITFLATLESQFPALFDKYLLLRQKIIDDGLGIVSDDLYYDFVNVCDAYYGDGTTVMGDFVKAGKPVMLQNYNV